MLDEVVEYVKLLQRQVQVNIFLAFSLLKRGSQISVSRFHLHFMLPQHKMVHKSIVMMKL